MAHRTLFAAIVAGLAAVPVAWACGPVFPRAYLTYGLEAEVLSLPEASFYHELSAVLGRAPEIKYLWSPRQRDAWAKNLTADADDLRAALTAQGTDEDTIERLRSDYVKMRQAMNTRAPLPSAFPSAMVDGDASESMEGVASEEGMVEEPNKREAFTLSDYENLLNLLPAEFAGYIRGADAYRARDFDGAIGHWRRLLALPEAERVNRSTWAAYMLGKARLLKRDYAGAIAAFSQVRDLAGAGFRDSLNLGPDSLGWQAAAETRLGDDVSAMHHYIDMFLSSAEDARNTGYTSLRWVCTRAMAAPDTFEVLAGDALCRRVLTAWVVANTYGQYNRQWLEMVAALNLSTPVESGDRLAWAAYEAGDMEGAKRWLAVADPESPYSQWVQSKLLLRDGKIEEAVALLSELTQSFPAEDRWIIGYEPETVPREIANAELGVLLLGREEYVNSLDCLMRSGYWIDAAYVAERVLTLDELKAYVGAQAQDPDLARPLSTTEYWQEEEHSRFELLRQLLGRRLARAGQWDNALPHYPEEVRATVDELRTYVAAVGAAIPPKGWGASISDFVSGLWGSKPGRAIDTARAEACFKAGQITRNNGMKLLGTEVEPDWHLFGGNFELGGVTEGRLAGQMYAAEPLNDALAQVLAASEDEKQRAAASAPAPNERFHYRYVAADLMWQSAESLPNNDPATVRALYWGGVYLKDRDPQAADKFYKALVWRNLNMPYAQAADEKRWFPAEPPDDWNPEGDH